jgi:sugar lactone lactonase YvrE
MRINEGVCDPDGRFYCGSMVYDQRQRAASLYRLDPTAPTSREGLEPETTRLPARCSAPCPASAACPSASLRAEESQ